MVGGKRQGEERFRSGEGHAPVAGEGPGAPGAGQAQRPEVEAGTGDSQLSIHLQAPRPSPFPLELHRPGKLLRRAAANEARLDRDGVEVRNRGCRGELQVEPERRLPQPRLDKSGRLAVFQGEASPGEGQKAVLQRHPGGKLFEYERLSLQVAVAHPLYRDALNAGVQAAQEGARLRPCEIGSLGGKRCVVLDAHRGDAYIVHQ